MSQFLDRVRDVDPNNSEAVKEALTAFFQNLSKHTEIDCNRWLRALENVINRFPKYCGQHRAAIETYLSHFLDSNNYYNVIEAAKCAHAVQQVRPQQEKTASAKSCWREQMSSLCNTAHTLLDALFVQTAQYNKTGKVQEQNQTTTPLQAALAGIVTVKPQAIVDKGTVLATRLRNVLVFIQAMLVEIYPVGKPIRPQLVLEVILHTLSAPANEDSTKVTTVKVQALKTLDAIVACLGSNLIPFSVLVFRFVSQTLRWSSEYPSEESRKVRCAAYNSLTKWLNTLHVHREPSAERARAWDTELTAHVVRDVTPPKQVIQLTANAQPMKNLSKKARRKLANSMLMKSNISSHMPGEKNKISMSEESNDEVTIAALVCAEAFLTSCGMFLKPTTHKQFQELLVRECYNIERYSCDRSLRLLLALEAARRACPARAASPARHCLQLYSRLVNSTQLEISKFSSQALLDIRLHLHCSPASLTFALEPPVERKRDGKRKKVSERNREALEVLLGKERVPSEKELFLEEEIITIPDEPASKRPRTDDDVEKISLSSESSASLVSYDSSVEELDDSNGTDYIIEPESGKETDVVTLEPTEETEQTSRDRTNVDEDEPDGQIHQDSEVNNMDSPMGLTQDNNDSDKENINIHEAITQAPYISVEISEETSISLSNDSDKENFNINEASMQAQNVSTETIEENSPRLSVEVAYDYPNTGQENVTVLEKMDEDNLPSTNDTDDIQITCGQAVRSSQDIELLDANDAEVKAPLTAQVLKENGIDKSAGQIVENGIASAEIESENVASKNAANGVEITVEDMLADFVDEVIETPIVCEAIVS